MYGYGHVDGGRERRSQASAKGRVFGSVTGSMLNSPIFTSGSALFTELRTPREKHRLRDELAVDFNRQRRQ